MPDFPAPTARCGALPPADPLALGATLRPDGVGVAVWAPEARVVWLCTFDDAGRTEQARHRLQPDGQGVWHGLLPTALGGRPGLVYGYRAEGPWAPAQGLRFNPQRLLLDPYATEVVGAYRAADHGAGLDIHLGHDPADPSRPHPQDNAPAAPKARVTVPAPVARPPRCPVPPAQRVVAEVHVQAATARHPGVPAALRGTYAGLAHPVMIEHWRRLGVTTLELLPLMQRADEARLQGLGLRNHWGYNTLAFFAAEPRYASGQGGLSPAEELRQALATLREAGFELWLDVVFNHTAETDAWGPTLSWRGLGNRQWYRLPPDDLAGYQNWAGCGNVLHLGQPMVLRFVMDALRHWVTHYGIDGFRFDLASVLARGSDGRFDAGGAFFAALQADPLLRRCAWVAEPWDLGPDGYQPGAYPPGWLEWNDRSRDTLRAAWLRPGDARGQRSELATRLAGSSDRFAQALGLPRTPLASVNFLTAHDGFTLRDLVSFNERHNHANGEHNRDGHHDNLSWNAGAEGPTTDAGVLALRARLQRGLLATLLLCRGTPMLLGGDELGHSQRGNNNAYCQDNALTWWDWDGADPDLLAFATRLLALRRDEPALHDACWLTGQPDPAQPDGAPDVAWAAADGHPLAAADWHHPTARHLRVHLLPPAGQGEALLLLNPDALDLSAALPAPRRGSHWWCRLDSAQPRGQGPCDPRQAGDLPLPGRSVQVWTSQPPPGAPLPLPPRHLSPEPLP
ncbi:glycogen debranching protein GlgX [Ideonella livida]|nr:glycogen debranching protein GlgX [Ideonella livida]